MVSRQFVVLFHIFIFGKECISNSLLTDGKRQNNDDSSLTTALQHIQSIDVLRQLINQETLVRLSMSKRIRGMSHDMESLKKLLTDTGRNCSDVTQQFDSEILKIKEYIKIHDKRISEQGLLIDDIFSEIKILNTTTSVILTDLKYDLSNLSLRLSGVKKNNLDINKKLSTAIEDFETLSNTMKTFKSDILDKQRRHESHIAELQEFQMNMTKGKEVLVSQPCLDISKNQSCLDIKNTIRAKSGEYLIYIGGTTKNVWCDMDTDGGGWTVIQRRQDGTTDFYRSWDEYKYGFGNTHKEYWIGNDALHYMTTERNVELRVDLEQLSGRKGYATYSTFIVANEASKYKLAVSGHSGTVDDCLSYNNGYFFTTKDRDNDNFPTNCAKFHHGAWWYNTCTLANLNGQYYTTPRNGKAYNIHCYQWTNNNRVALRKTKMMIR